MQSEPEPKLEAEIARIRALGLHELRTLWRSIFRTPPPPAFTKDLIAQFVSWQVQEQSVGGLDKDTVRFLDGLARGDKDLVEAPKPGTVLVREYQGSFASITQSFNTTTSMGRLTLNMLLSFAQFEREVIGERVRNKLAASKRKGIWVGGPVPLGYRAAYKKFS